MKAAQISSYGGSEVVEINQNVPEPAALPGKIIVEVRAAGANPFDWKLRKGLFAQAMPLRFPATLGGDFSGIVKDSGGVSTFKAGDVVYGQANVLAGGSGSFAEVLTADEGKVALKPARATHIEAAALPLVGTSAIQALTEHMRLGKGSKVLIHGGAGGIGAIAIQIGKHLGARVATTVAGKDAAYVRGLGADEVIDYETQRFEDAVKDCDAVFDTVGEETYARSFSVVKKGGIIVSMLETPNRELIAKYGVNSIAQFTGVTSARLMRLSELVAKGVVTVRVDKVFPLERVGEALAYLESGQARGKVVVEVSSR